MAKWVRIEDGRCAEFVDFDPTGMFHESLVWLPVPANLEGVADYSWVTKDGVTIEPLSLDSAKAKAKANVAALRYSKEIAGVMLGDNQVVPTDRESQAKVHAVLYGFDKGFSTEVTYKTANGFITFTSDSFAPVAAAVFAFVQQCFNAESNHHAQIDALTDSISVATYDFSAGWPTTARDNTNLALPLIANVAA